MTWPLVKFVDSPSTTATVRFNFNDQTATAPRQVATFDAGVPTLEGDPDAIGQTFGHRFPTVTLRIKGTKPNALAALSALSRELLRQTNWLMFQLSNDTSPRWFKTYRTGYQPLSLDRVYVNLTTGGKALLPDTWDVTVPLAADAFTYGPRESVAQAQIIQAPADLAGPTRLAMRYVLPAIKGDAPTKLRVQVTPAAGLAVGVGGRTAQWLIGCVAGKTTMADPVIEIGTGDGFTAGTGTAAATAVATNFGGSGRTVTIAANDLTAGNNFARRLTGNLPAVQPGRYKVMLRCEASAAGLLRDFIFAFGQETSAPGAGGFQYGPTAVVQHHDFTGWVDLGEFTFPFGVNIPDGISGTTPVNPFTLKVGTSDNTTGTVRLDAFKLVPVSGRTVAETTLLKATFGASKVNPLAGGVLGTFDGDTELYWSVDGSNVFLTSSVSMTGSYPTADPAAEQNLLLVMAIDDAGYGGGGTGITALNAQSAVDVSYHPRYLHIGDGT